MKKKAPRLGSCPTDGAATGWGSLCSADRSKSQRDHPPEPTAFWTIRYQRRPTKDCQPRPAAEDSGSIAQGGSGLPRYGGAKDEHGKSQNWASPENPLVDALVEQRGQPKPRKGKGLAQSHR